MFIWTVQSVPQKLWLQCLLRASSDARLHKYSDCRGDEGEYVAGLRTFRNIGTCCCRPASLIHWARAAVPSVFWCCWNWSWGLRLGADSCLPALDCLVDNRGSRLCCLHILPVCSQCPVPSEIRDKWLKAPASYVFLANFEVTSMVSPTLAIDLNSEKKSGSLYVGTPELLHLLSSSKISKEPATEASLLWCGQIFGSIALCFPWDEFCSASSALWVGSGSVATKSDGCCPIL